MSNAPHRPDAEEPRAETVSLSPSWGEASPIATGLHVEALPERIGDYHVLRKLGEGGMGAVYLAEDARLGRKVAVKTMRLALASDPDHRHRFLREARAAAAVEHDNIVPVWGIGEAADGSPYIAMPFLQGEMLESRLKREPVSPLWLIVEVGRDTAEGLAAAHARGLIHRDIKPANIWLEGDPAAPEPAAKVRRAKILDFGLARSVSPDEAQLTASGAVLGTPAYMAPEQARGEAVDARADLWSLGATLYRMATGRQPFEGPTTIAVLCALMADTPPPVRVANPAIPPALATLIDQLLQKDPAVRLKSAAEVAARLRQVAGSFDLTAAKSAPPLPTPLAVARPSETMYAGDTDPDHPLPAAEEVEADEPAWRKRPNPNLNPDAVRAALRRAPGPKMPVSLAVLVLLVVVAAGVYIVRPETYSELAAKLRQVVPGKKGGEKAPDGKLAPPATPVKKPAEKQPGGIRFSKPDE